MATERAGYYTAHPEELLLDDELPGAGSGGETLAEYTERWLAERERKGSCSLRQDRSRLATHVLPVLGPKAIRGIVTPDLEAFVQRLDEHVQAGAMSWYTARHAWGLTSKLFDDAAHGKNLGLRLATALSRKLD